MASVDELQYRTGWRSSCPIVSMRSLHEIKQDPGSFWRFSLMTFDVGRKNLCGCASPRPRSCNEMTRLASPRYGVKRIVAYCSRSSSTTFIWSRQGITLEKFTLSVIRTSMMLAKRGTTSKREVYFSKHKHEVYSMRKLPDWKASLLQRTSRSSITFCFVYLPNDAKVATISSPYN